MLALAYLTMLQWAHVERYRPRTKGYSMRASIHYCLRGPHKGLWSVTDRRGASSPTNGKVIAHVDHAVLHGATFKVSEASRLAVLRTGQRSVHARVFGEVNLTERGTLTAVSAHYNPYRASTFTRSDTFAPVHSANIVVFGLNGRCYI